jgi:hypothetical protein
MFEVSFALTVAFDILVVGCKCRRREERGLKSRL